MSSHLSADAAGVLDRVITVFADLGLDDEWPGTVELAAEHSGFYGLPHEVVYREVTMADSRRAIRSIWRPGTGMSPSRVG